MKTLVVLLEEASAREMLKGVLARILPDDIQIEYMVFEGKSDLDRHLETRLRYWQRADSCFLIVRDQDSGDCRAVKAELRKKIEAGGKSAVSLIRIACHELENFYLGDLEAVERGLGLSGLSRLQLKQKFRDPDRLANASDELRKITQRKYQKILGSRAIAPYLKVDRSNRSRSFNALLDGIAKLLEL